MKDRSFEIAINPKYDGYQKGLASKVCKFFDKKTESGASFNEELSQELHKPVIKKFTRSRVYTRFTDDIWAAELAEMLSLSCKNQDAEYLLSIIDVFIKYARVQSFKDKKEKTALYGFIEVVDESNRKPNRLLWVDQEK